MEERFSLITKCAYAKQLPQKFEGREHFPNLYFGLRGQCSMVLESSYTKPKTDYTQNKKLDIHKIHILNGSYLSRYVTPIFHKCPSTVSHGTKKHQTSLFSSQY
jgi:hypothetical protein